MQEVDDGSAVIDIVRRSGSDVFDGAWEGSSDFLSPPYRFPVASALFFDAAAIGGKAG